jgi:SAM-dependent methyltransferase
MAGAHENAYDEFAAAYARDNETNAWNALYERPAVLSLLGDVAGLRVLDAGCGAGAHAAALVERRAVVTGVDASSAMVALAGERLPGRARFVRADLTDPLRFDADSFDAVLASLVMHYVRDWEPTLREFHRVLAPGGRLVISTHHPFMDHVLARGTDYFATYDFSEEWSKGGQTMTMRFWHRPLSAIVRSLHDAGFVIEELAEPAPEPAVREVDPDAWRSLTTKPHFIFFAARAI